MPTHEHEHHHIPQSVKILTIALLFTFLFSAIEVFYGYKANSLALLSDAGHMFADALALGLATFAAWIATKPPSSKHTYGLGRAEVIGAWISTIFVTVVAVSIIAEAINRFHHAESVTGSTVIIVAGIGFLMNALIAWILSRGEKNLNVRAAILHVVSDLLGCLAALISGVIIYFAGWMLIDPLLSIVISILILISSIRLLRESFSVLMEGVPPHLDFHIVGNAITEIEHVRHVHDLHVWTLATGSVVLTAHIEIDHIELWDNLLEEIRTLVSKRFHIEHITLQPETPKTKITHHLPCHKHHF